MYRYQLYFYIYYLDAEKSTLLKGHCRVLVSEDRLDSLASGGDVTEPISDSAFVSPPDYATVMNEDDMMADTEVDTDDCAVLPVTHPKSPNTPDGTDSGGSNHSSHQLLPDPQDT